MQGNLGRTASYQSRSRASFPATVTPEQLIRDLKRLGVRRGDHLALGVSFRSLGKVAGGPETLVRALLRAVGPEGTLMAPAFTLRSPRTVATDGRMERLFDPERTPAYTGVVSETLRQWPGALRSRHPVCSVVALGRLAEALTHDHGPDQPSYLPYSRLADHSGKVLSIGIGDNLVAIRHQAQYLAGLLDVVPLRQATRYRDETGRVRSFVRRDPAGCVHRLPELVAVLRERGLVTDGRIGEGGAVLVPAADALRVMTGLLRENPARNLCGAWSCLWCRELERRLDLYDSIENPRFFQRRGMVARVTGMANGGRLAFENLDSRYTGLIKRGLRAARRMMP